MKRREFINFLGGAAAAWPLAARAQTTRRFGILFATSAQAAARGLLQAVTQGLKDDGLVEGRISTSNPVLPMAKRMHYRSSPRSLCKRMSLVGAQNVA